jgi:4'-phosphopantetheinyl transferase EntD
VEAADPLEDELIAMVCRPEELEEARRRTRAPAGVAAKLIFSAKEAVYKCCYPSMRERWEFDDVWVRIEPRGGFLAEPPGRAALPGRYAFAASRVVTGVILP